jgi:hypothetical protein
VQTVEPEFDEEQLAWVLAYEQYVSDLGPHGIPMGEATASENQFGYVGDDLPQVDWAMKALLDAQDRYYKKYPDGSRNGHLWAVRKKEGV